jgi:hypothetical protein
MGSRKANGDTSLTIDASEKRQWSTVTCASCGQLFFFRRLQLEKAPIFSTAWEAKRRLLRPRPPLSKFLDFQPFGNSHIHKQAKEPFGSFPFKPIACINAGYAGSSRATASADFRRGPTAAAHIPSYPRSAYFAYIK